ncbi:MAG: hypothetical protein P9M06_00675 [Candidatus Saelkia tenebricola]|nr:hypothetical protein [Candidatus Saelkia tenebricola]
MDEEYLEFNEVEELPEELDFDNTKKCPHCNNPVPGDSLLCLYCGGRVVSNSRSLWFILTAIIVCIIFTFVLFLIFF